MEIGDERLYSGSNQPTQELFTKPTEDVKSQMMRDARILEERAAKLRRFDYLVHKYPDMMEFLQLYNELIVFNSQAITGGALGASIRR